MTNFKITGKTHESKKSHYVVEREHEKKEHILDKRKEFYQDNKDKILEERSKYYKENYKNKIAVKRQTKEKCFCGMVVSSYYMKRHQKSDRHNILVKKLENAVDDEESDKKDVDDKEDNDDNEDNENDIENNENDIENNENDIEDNENDIFVDKSIDYDNDYDSDAFNTDCSECEC